VTTLALERVELARGGRTLLRDVSFALDGGVVDPASRSSVVIASPMNQATTASAGTSSSPIGTERSAPTPATAATAGSRTDSIGTPAV